MREGWRIAGLFLYSWVNTNRRYVTIALAGPLKSAFTYHLDNPAILLQPGCRVVVPFGRANKTGFYLGPAEAPDGFLTKPIMSVLDQISYFPPELFRLCLWMADYYFANPADCLTSALPAALKTNQAVRYLWTEQGIAARASQPNDMFTKKRAVQAGKALTVQDVALLKKQNAQTLGDYIRTGSIVEEWPYIGTKGKLIRFQLGDPATLVDFAKGKRKKPLHFEGPHSRASILALGWSANSFRSALSRGIMRQVYIENEETTLPFITAKADVSSLSLTLPQQTVVDKLKTNLGAGFSIHLLHGITGSGKTLVYCHLARDILAKGQTALVLTPEIALTGAILAYFRGFFDSQVTVIHSGMTERERLESWRGIREGKYKIVIGPRSAVFAPLENVGLIVVDEEHDSSYKQDDPAPRFHGRDTAIMRAKIHSIPIILGSASPSVESYYHAVNGRYQLHELTGRPAGAELPSVRLIDLKKEQLSGDLTYMTYPLKKEIEKRLDQDEQVIVYLNRRGYSRQLKCGDCAHISTCPQCHINLTYHKVGGKLLCHYCGYAANPGDTCEKCNSRNLMYVGAGTQRVEEDIPRLFPQAVTARFDSDTASGRARAYTLLREFAEQKQNLLLGTQMVTKGLDLPGVTLVGVLSADQGLDMPDFRASEKTFARLVQVAGRSGRSRKKGEVIIQTSYPHHPVIMHAAAQDYKGFYDGEIKSRHEYNFPPFIRLANVVFSGTDETILGKASQTFKTRLADVCRKAGIPVETLGPAQCPIYQLKARYRRQLLIKTTQMVKFSRTLTEWESQENRFGLPSSVLAAVDIDPDDMM
ncbi:MAG: primosomal protein N' [candidate division Zixibacteria bacterium]|nr:primosomal protein N' [candidate division Zixibacteria bacterium]